MRVKVGALDSQAASTSPQYIHIGVHQDTAQRSLLGKHSESSPTHPGRGVGYLGLSRDLYREFEKCSVSLRRRQLGAQKGVLKGGRLRRLAGANKFRMWKKSFLGCPSKEGLNVPECGESRRGERAGGGQQEGATRQAKLTPWASLPQALGVQ